MATAQSGGPGARRRRPFNLFDRRAKHAAIRAMKAIVWIGVVLSLLIGLVAIMGWLLPRQHSASAEADFKTDLETLSARLRNFREYPRWRSGLTAVEAESDAIWTELDSHGDRVRYQMSAVQRDANGNGFTTTILSDDLPYGGEWRYQIVPNNAGGATLRITETGFITNPLFRFVARFVIGYDFTIKRFINDLKQFPFEDS